MIKVTYFFDNRRPYSDGTSPVRLKVSLKSDRTFITSSVRLTDSDWEKLNDPSNRDSHLQMLRRSLDRMRMDIEDVIYDLERNGDPKPLDVRNAYEERIDPGKSHQRIAKEKEKTLLRTWFTRRMELKTGKTLDSISQTLKKVDDFDPKAKLDDITPSWLQKFDLFMSKTSSSPNARAVHMRNLRAVINFAIDEGATQTYAFRRFRIKTVKTAKRSLAVEQLRSFFNIKGLTDSDRKYLDLFKLMFLLVGINSVDLFHLKRSNVHDGRIEYTRSKTKRFYSIKLEPEAVEIIEKYRGMDWLVDPLDKVGNWEYYRIRMNKTLRTLGDTTIGKHGKKEREAMFPQITTYWARHSWATIARSIGISVDDIALALGHGDGHDLTHIYIDDDKKKVDEANRRVIDWVLYGKK